MPGNHVFTDRVAPNMVRLMKNKLVHCQYFNRQNERDFNEGQPIGDTLRVKLPYRGVIRDGFGYVGANIDRRYTTIVADQMFGIDVDWDTIERAIQMERSQEDINENILDPLAAQMAQELDSRASRFAYLNTNNVIGALGVVPTAMATYSGARTRIFENAGWASKKRAAMIVTPDMMGTVVAGTPNILGLFNPTDVVSKAFKKGYIGEYGEFQWYESMSLYQHTTGIWASLTGVTINAANQSGNSITVAATTGDTFNAGDIISIGSAGTAVNNVNPMTRRSTGRIKHFKIMATTTAAASTATLSIYPSIVGSGPYQNVSQLPPNGAVLTLMPGTTMVAAAATTGIFGQALTNEAFAMVAIDLPMPKAGTMDVISKYTDDETGISIGIIRAFDFDARRWKTRFDTWVGFGQLLGDNCACLIGSNT